MVVSSHPTHGKRHSFFNEGNHRNDNLPFVSIYNHLVWSTILQGNPLWNVIFGPKALHTSGEIYEVLESTYLSKLRESKGNVFEKEQKIKRLRRLAEKKRT